MAIVSQNLKPTLINVTLSFNIYCVEKSFLMQSPFVAIRRTFLCKYNNNIIKDTQKKKQNYDFHSLQMQPCSVCDYLCTWKATVFKCNHAHWNIALLIPCTIMSTMSVTSKFTYTLC